MMEVPLSIVARLLERATAIALGTMATTAINGGRSGW